MKINKSKKVFETQAKYTPPLIARKGMLAQHLARSNHLPISSNIKSPPHYTSTFLNQNHLNKICKLE